MSTVGATWADNTSSLMSFIKAIGFKLNLCTATSRQETLKPADKLHFFFLNVLLPETLFTKSDFVNSLKFKFLHVAFGTI